MEKLIARKFTDQKFRVAGGYIMPKGEWGICNTVTGAWVALSDGKIYIPVGGKGACAAVAETSDPTKWNYISEIK